MKTIYSIGEFSQITGLPAKTLRFYHEKGILVPSSIDETTGYRFYDQSKVEKARVIKQLRAMEFSLEDIALVLGQCADEADIVNFLEKQKRTLQARIQEDRDIVQCLTQIIEREQDAKKILAADSFQVEEKRLAAVLVAGIRMKGKYSECGSGFQRLAKTAGRHLCGKPLCLYYDGEYRDDDAEFETCFPVRKEFVADGVSVRTLPAAQCLSIIHRGAYAQLGRSYERILREAKQREARLVLPSREVYLKGPGLIFKGNPNNYLTEIVLPLEA